VIGQTPSDGRHMDARTVSPWCTLWGPGLRRLSLLACVVAGAPAARAQDSPGKADASPLVDGPTRTRVIEGVIRRVRETYVFPAVADSIGVYLRGRMRHGAYDRPLRADAFATELTADLRSASHDQHLHVTYEPQSIHAGPGVDSATRHRRIDAVKRELERGNYGVPEARIVADGVGYLRLTSMQAPSIAGETLAAAMTFLAHSDALIIDVRDNGGGDADQVNLLLSYLFDGAVEFGEMRSRDPGHVEQSWTAAYVPGRRYGGTKPIFVLTSHTTFSAAEAVAYFLQAQRHAIVVGDTTRGGANPGDFYAVDTDYVIFVPDARAVSPVTGANWEGTGVIPNIAVPAAAALDTARALALAVVRTVH
jgi:peptidase S41-like protein